MIKPIWNKVLIKIDETETKTIAGILIPVESQKSSLYATVLEIGPDVDCVKKDDRILLDKFHNKFTLDDGSSIIEDTDILGLVI